MGGSSWSDHTYSSRVSHRAAHNVPTFDYSDKVKSGAVATKVHDKLNPFKVMRESRDSDAHPESRAIIVAFDVTGSMGVVPTVVQKKLPALMSLLIRKGIVAHPQILHAGIGDFFADRVPLQTGQFESGIEMEDDLTNIYLEGGGGGQQTESYGLAMYFAARQTSIDCWDKRGQKGFLFIIGDELPFKTTTKRELETVVGASVEADMSIERLVQEASARYHVFFIIPGGTSYCTEKWLSDGWKKLLGAEHVLKLDNPEDVCETIATAIGVMEGTMDAARVVDALLDAGVDKLTATNVATATGALAKSAALARVGTGDLPVGAGASGTARL